jgi:hypothetical protein
MSHVYTTQVASDIDRDGLGVELLDEARNVVAEVFRSDREHTVCVNTFSNEIPLEALEQLLTRARERLEPFENGKPLSAATLVGPRHASPKW